VHNLYRALDFYRVPDFSLLHRAVGDDVAIIRNEHDVEINLIFNANAGDPAANVLMDAPEKYPGYTHMALRVVSIPASASRATLKASRATEGVAHRPIRRTR
jgi:lactoylglutathione lyase